MRERQTERQRDSETESENQKQSKVDRQKKREEKGGTNLSIIFVVGAKRLNAYRRQSERINASNQS